MASFHKKVTGFLFSKPGIILGFLLDFIMIAIAVTCFIVNMQKKIPVPSFVMFCNFFTLGVGILGLSVSISRAKKLKKANAAN